MSTPTEYRIPAQLLQQLIAIVGSLPYAQVAPTMDALKSVVLAQEQPAAEEPAK